MGFDTRRPPLPAPTETETDNDTTLRGDDVATNLSSRTDKTSYSIPEDGTPVTINTAKTKGGLHKKYPSQTSLLIEYFEASKNEGKSRSRPSVRVRVTPSSRKNKSKASDHLQITQTSRKTGKPSYTQRISLNRGGREETAQPTEVTYSEGSNLSSLPPVEIEVLASELSSQGGRYVPAPSDISSMPPDSMLDSHPVIIAPPRRRSRSLEREEVAREMAAQDTLRAPSRQRSRSLSKERITQRVMEKLQQKPLESDSAAVKSAREELSSSRKSKRTSRSSREEEMSAVSGTESSLLSSNAGVKRRSGDTQSMRSGMSGTSSINNPKLLATVEDAIKRLILPEINALKEQQKTQSNREKYERLSRGSDYTVDSNSSRDPSRRRVSKSSSAPHMHGSKPKVVLNRDGDDPGTVISGTSSRRERRSSRGSGSERSYADSVSREEERTRRKKSKDKDGGSARDAALLSLGAAGLTAAALKHHESQEEAREEKKDRRKRRSKGSGSRSTSISESVDDRHEEVRETVPPLPILQSELQGSEITRDSILSAATETRERPGSGSSRSTGPNTPLREVPRGLASPVSITPTRTPVPQTRGLGTSHSNQSQGDLTMRTPKSDRGFASRSREPTNAALDAAAAAKARAIESTEAPTSQYEIMKTPPRNLSPVQSEASYRGTYREEIHVAGSPRVLQASQSSGTVSSMGQPKLVHQASNLSIQSFDSTPSSSKGARTRRRPQGDDLSRSREMFGEPSTPGDVDDFFEKNHEQNEMYRREFEESSQIGTPYVEYHQLSNITENSAEGNYFPSHARNLSLQQDIRKVGSNPEYVPTPVAVESAVASLYDPGSAISVPSSAASPIKKSRLSQVSPVQEQVDASREAPTEAQQRWAAIRNRSQKNNMQPPPLANSPRQSIANSIDEKPQMQASAFPTQDHVMPEIGFGMEDDSDMETNPSIIKGPLGGAFSAPHSSQHSAHHLEERAQTPTQHSYSNAAALGAGAGAAAIAAAAATRLRDEHSPLPQEEQYHASLNDEYDHGYSGEHYMQQPNFAQSDRAPTESPGMWRDEGYQSANQPGGVTPDPRERKLFQDDGFGEYDDDGLGDEGMFGAPLGHSRHASGNSHGMGSPLYDAATGKGLDRIQSKDVVALMDHLTVRDAQRNARDTEILVTLVRSAAEMRNSFEEMKEFIRTQDAMIMSQNDKRANVTEQRILQGPRPQPLGSPRVPRSSTEDFNDVEQKRKNVFKRALKGLSMKGDNDIKKIEAMLIQLLGEVEGLKEAQTLNLSQHNRSNSLNSYENLRASGDPGYEPEGRSGTAESPNQSGFLSNPSSRRLVDMRSGFDLPHEPHRVSTVAEEDEEYEEDGPYENTERMTTPTQEARRNNSLSQETPPPASRAYRDSSQSQENTPKRKHKSNTSSLFGIPKISRWSKTTTSSHRDSESLPRNSGSGEQRPYSAGSGRSGSQVNIAYFGDGQYDLRDDERYRSNPSLVQEDLGGVRSPSPLIPSEDGHDQYGMDDPKYQAHRNSLNLQHPQPRPGPTGRHQSYLESQAQVFSPVSVNSVRSPDFDQWGSNPSLARNRLSNGPGGYGAGNLSPISSDGGYSQHSASEQAAAPPRPPKIRDDGPLIPPQPLAGHGQTRQMYSAANEFGGSPGALTPLAPIQEVRYSLETDNGYRVSS